MFDYSFSADAAPASARGTDSSYCPLGLEYRQDGRQWGVDFQAFPCARVICRGDRPTEAELQHVLRALDVPEDVRQALVVAVLALTHGAEVQHG